MVERIAESRGTKRPSSATTDDDTTLIPIHKFSSSSSTKTTTKTTNQKISSSNLINKNNDDTSNIPIHRHNRYHLRSSSSSSSQRPTFSPLVPSDLDDEEESEEKFDKFSDEKPFDLAPTEKLKAKANVFQAQRAKAFNFDTKAPTEKAQQEREKAKAKAFDTKKAFGDEELLSLPNVPKKPLNKHKKKQRTKLFEIQDNDDYRIEVDTTSGERYAIVQIQGMERRVPLDRAVRVYADGIYDCFHFGHARSLQQAKNLFPDTQLVVGVCGDDVTVRMKGKVVMSEEERAECVSHCRYVDEVIERAPWVVTPDFLQRHRIDFVSHGEDVSLDEKGIDVYRDIKLAGQFLTIKRTEGISTTDIILRIVKDYDSYVRRNLQRGHTYKEMNVGFVKEKSIQLQDTVDKVVFDVKKWTKAADTAVTSFLDSFQRDSQQSSPSASASASVSASALHRARQQEPSSSFIDSLVKRWSIDKGDFFGHEIPDDISSVIPLSTLESNGGRGDQSTKQKTSSSSSQEFLEQEEYDKVFHSGRMKVPLSMTTDDEEDVEDGEEEGDLEDL